ITPTFDEAQAIHRKLALSGVRLGQPVKCVRRSGKWGGTLRIGLSMPRVVELCAVSAAEAEALLRRDMRQIAHALRNVANPSEAGQQNAAC
ncbi:MAG: hypothetical protein HKN38_11040, partial [Altererythrobacter sp.]|nr:hypothetical protein [Altererythrobacter sp.]